jgi:hypothetical protein
MPIAHSSGGNSHAVEIAREADRGGGGGRATSAWEATEKRVLSAEQAKYTVKDSRRVSPDGSLFYLAKTDFAWRLVIDRRQRKVYDSILGLKDSNATGAAHLAFTPDGTSATSRCATARGFW